jgi:acetyl-CoA acyltransferase
VLPVCSALRSQERTAKGSFERQIGARDVPVPLPQHKGDPVVVERDEHPRETSLEALAAASAFPCGECHRGKLLRCQRRSGCRTVASDRAVERYGLTPLPRVNAVATVGVRPRVTGIGPEPAVRKLLARSGVDITAVDVIEFNEAFASQTLAGLRGLGLADDAEHVNPNGGAIAFRHPFGASGARRALTAAIELADRAPHGVRRAVETLCIGLGQGIAALFEAPDGNRDGTAGAGVVHTQGRGPATVSIAGTGHWRANRRPPPRDHHATYARDA